MAGTAEFEKNVFSQIECFAELEAPREIFYRLSDLFSLGSPQRPRSCMASSSMGRIRAIVGWEPMISPLKPC